MSYYICLDFDGVVHSYISRWQGACHIPDPPVLGAIDFIRNSMACGICIGIYSTRNIEPGGIKAMCAWLRENGLEEEFTAKIDFPASKPNIATLFVDDRGYQFTGFNWPSYDYIKTFKPWNKQ
jgi:hypothetical protein